MTSTSPGGVKVSTLPCHAKNVALCAENVRFMIVTFTTLGLTWFDLKVKCVKKMDHEPEQQNNNR